MAPYADLWKELQDVYNSPLPQLVIPDVTANGEALEILKRELKIQLIEQNRIKESEFQTLESKLKIADILYYPP